MRVGTWFICLAFLPRYCDDVLDHKLKSPIDRQLSATTQTTKSLLHREWFPPSNVLFRFAGFSIRTVHHTTCSFSIWGPLAGKD
jgi:hypothetical protein